MKNLKNSNKVNNKKTAPDASPQRVPGSMGRQVGNNRNNHNNRNNTAGAKKPLSSKKPKPAPKKQPPKRQPGNNLPNRPNNTAKGGNTELQKKPVKKPAAPAKPVDKRTRRAADKAARNKQAAVKKANKYHGGSYILYYIFAGIIVVLVLIVLANTVLFRCKEITVSGNFRYSSDEIIADSGLSYGQNLLHVKRNAAAEKIVSALPYVDSAEVKRSFPSTIEISVAEAEKRFAVKEGAVTAAVSYKGKIVEQGSFSELPLVVGMECGEIKTGSWLKSKIETKNGIPEAILDAAELVSMDNISKIDITDRFSLEMELDNGRIIIRLGTASDLENKINIAKKFVDTEIGETESVTIIVSNPTRVTLHPNIPNEEPETPSKPETSGDPAASGSPEASDPAASSQ